MKLMQLTVLAFLTIALVGPPAHAGNFLGTGMLMMTDWYSGNWNPSIYTSIYSGATGPFAWSFNGQAQDTPVYCMDIFHYFFFDEPFSVNVYSIPPDPPSPPPYNTDHAAWVYETYGSKAVLDLVADDDERTIRAAAVQTALWEISHDELWYDHSSNWLELGDFHLLDHPLNNADVISGANDILIALHSELNAAGEFPSWAGTATWYDPIGYENPGDGQGVIGDRESPIIPEPTALALVGVSLLVFGSFARRRRP